MKGLLNQSPKFNHQTNPKRQKQSIGVFRSIGRKIGLSPPTFIANHLANKQNTQNHQNQTNKGIMKRSCIDIGTQENLLQRKKTSYKQKDSKRINNKIKPTMALQELSLNCMVKNVDAVQKEVQDNMNKLALNINYLHSNKAFHDSNQIKQKLHKQVNENQSNNLLVQKTSENGIISEGLSKDGQFYVVSRVMEGEQLKKAVQLEYKNSNKSKKSCSVSKKMLQSPRNNSVPTVQESKISNKENGIIKAYAVNTHQGISRKYNEDRVSIILNISKNGVKASYFAIYDGHGGTPCCDFLSQNLHQYILNSKKFPSSPRQALIEGIKNAQKKFVQITKKKFKIKQELDRSGSCVLISLVVGNDIYIANLGDSRAVLSTCKGKPLYSLSRDHKPTDLNQQLRIIKQGGKIYRTQMIKKEKKQDQKQNIVVGPLRVYPGKLSVTRTIGDIEAKQKQLGGIQDCISTDPQICKYTISGKEDFIVLGCDGIYEKMDSQQVVQEIWKSINKTKNKLDLHRSSGKAAEAVIKQCMKKKSSDNLTVILICLGQLGISSQAQYRSI